MVDFQKYTRQELMEIERGSVSIAQELDQYIANLCDVYRDAVKEGDSAFRMPGYLDAIDEMLGVVKHWQDACTKAIGSKSPEEVTEAFVKFIAIAIGRAMTMRIVQEEMARQSMEARSGNANG